MHIDVGEVKDLIVGYLMDRPDSGDTLEGIANWWIGRHWLKVEMNKVKRAVELLAAENILQEVRVDGKTLYRLHPEAEKAVKEMQNSREVE